MSKTKPLKALLVGCGLISDAWFRPALAHPDCELVGLVDIDLHAAEAKREQYELTVPIGQDVATMISLTQPDVIFDLTVPTAHRAVTTTALQMGCHVLGEKPLADSMDNARAMQQVAAESGRFYAVMQNRRYLPGIIRLRDFVRSGKIGRLTTLHADFFIGMHFTGFRAQMAHVLLEDMAIHSFDQARFLAEAEPTAVYCHEWNPPESWQAGGGSAVAIFEMEQEMLFTYRGSWASEGLSTAWACEWRLIGTKGTAVWDGEADIRAEIGTGPINNMRRTETAVVVPQHPPLAYEGHAGIIDEFLTAVRTGKRPQTHVDDNIRSLAMVHAAIASAQQKARILL